MKSFYLSIMFLAAVCYGSKAQNAVTDTHPGSIIYAIDYATGQENLNESDQAILFKDALIELVSHTSIARQHLTGLVPGHKNFVVTQMNPQTNGNAYQLVLQNKFMGQITSVYTFLYNADDNTLSFYDPQSQNYLAVLIEGYNINNQNNCFAYGKFNSPNPPETDNNGNQTTVAIPADQPVDQNVSAAVVPPPMPEYQQPQCPTDGYLWQPGYWAYSVDSNGYYWVPGAWVGPPNTDLLWTPPYWGLVSGLYIFHGGYWGQNVGFYGGINYGYGYGGYGYGGGEWHGGHYRYNTAVTNVNTTVIRNTYVNNTVINNTTVNNRSSFNGAGGVTAKPTTTELAVMKEKHVMPTAEQNRNQQIARSDKSQFAVNNSGKPASLAVVKIPAKVPVSNSLTTGTKAGANLAPRAKPYPNVQSPANQVIGGAANNKVNSNTGIPSNPAGTHSDGRPGVASSHPGSLNTSDHPAIPGSANTKPGMQGQPNTRPGMQGTNRQKPVTQPKQNNKAPASSKSNDNEPKKKS